MEVVTLHVKLICEEAFRFESFHLPLSIAAENRFTKDKGNKSTRWHISASFYLELLRLFIVRPVFWFDLLLELG